MRHARARALLVSSMWLATAAWAEEGCDQRPFGAVEKRGMDAPPASDDKWFPVNDHAAAPRPRQGLTETSWGWGCTATLVVDLDKRVAAQINRCIPGSSDYEALWSGYAKRAQTVSRRTLQNGTEQWEAVESRALEPAQIAAFVCAANKVWHDAVPLPLEQTPVPPHSVSYVRLWDGNEVKFIGGSRFPDQETNELTGLAYGWFRS